jgi:hypothetical protein
LVVIVFASAQLHLAQYRSLDLRDDFLASQLTWWLHTLWIAALVTWLGGRIDWLKSGFEKLADRLSVFLYIYLPLTILGLFVVIARTIG